MTVRIHYLSPRDTVSACGWTNPSSPDSLPSSSDLTLVTCPNCLAELAALTAATLREDIIHLRRASGGDTAYCGVLVVEGYTSPPWPATHSKEAATCSSCLMEMRFNRKATVAEIERKIAAREERAAEVMVDRILSGPAYTEDELSLDWLVRR